MDYFLIIFNLDFDNNVITFHLLSNYKGFKNLRCFKLFSESGAYNWGGAYIQSYDPRGGAVMFKVYLKLQKQYRIYRNEINNQNRF